MKVALRSNLALKDIKPVTRTSLSDEIVEQIIDLISRDVLKPGERLPAERELCKTFGVGRTSLREALRSLAVMGILDGRVGEGTFVCNNNRKHLEKVLQWGFLLDRKKVQDLLETRLTLESQTAFLAAQRATADDLAEIERALAGMEGAVGEPDRFLEFDLHFHLLIAQATQNSILASLLGTTRAYLQEWIKGSLAQPTAPGKGERARLSLNQHGRILSALEERRPEEAREEMSAHILSSSVDLRRHIKQKAAGG